MSKTSIGDDADFADVPKGSIPASASGVYRQDHDELRRKTFPGQMQQQPQRYDHIARQQQMR